MPQTTLGYERLFNWGLAESDEETFVSQVLEGQPEPPAYFAMMKAMNRDGAPTRTGTSPPDISAGRIAALIRQDATVVDTRPAADFAIRHAHGTITIPYGKSFLTWSGALLPYDRDIFLIVAEGGDEVKGIADELALIGLDRIGGAYVVTSFAELEAEGIAPRSMPQMDVDALIHQTRNGVFLVDVRGTDEWDKGHIPGAVHIPLGSLESRLGELPSGGEVALQCQGGDRSAIAASILEKHGISASNLAGGLDEWERFGGVLQHGGGGTPR